MARCRRWLLAFLCLFTASNHDSHTTHSSSSIRFAAAQERPFYTTPQFTNITHRTFVCDLFSAYANGTKGIRNLLEGLELSVGVVDQGNDIFVRLNRTDPDRNNWSIIEEDPGIFVHILDELAARGKFTWRNSFAWVQPPKTSVINPDTSKAYTWTDVLLDSVTRYDFSFAEWVHNQERRSLGISFPVGWFDASTILVQNEVQTVPELELIAFVRPFSKEVWYMICAVIFFSGIIDWAIDKIRYSGEKNNTVVANTYFATLMFTQHHAYENAPLHSKRIFGVSGAMLSLVLVAAYTANLASFLVAQKRPIIWAETLKEVEQNRIDLCVRAGSAVYGQISEAYPGVRFQPDDDFDEVYESLRKGRCKVMASRLADYDAFKNDYIKNPNCTLKWVGRAQFINKGGLATLVDTSRYCTSLIKHVLDIHMHEMIAEGVIDVLWNTHLSNLDNKTLCGVIALEEARSNTLDGGYALRITDVAGVFIFHGILILISIVVTFLESPWRRKRHRKKAEREAKKSEELQQTEEQPGKNFIQRIQGSMRNMFDHRPSGGERLHTIRSTGYDDEGGRPSMERIHSMKSIRNLGDGGRPSMERLHSMRSQRYSKGSSYGDQQSPLRSPDDVLQSIQRMQAKLDRLQRYGEHRRNSKGSSGARSPRSSRDTPRPRLSVINDEEDGSSSDER